MISEGVYYVISKLRIENAITLISKIFGKKNFGQIFKILFKNFGD